MKHLVIESQSAVSLAGKSIKLEEKMGGNQFVLSIIIFILQLQIASAEIVDKKMVEAEIETAEADTAKEDAKNAKEIARQDKLRKMAALEANKKALREAMKTQAIADREQKNAEKITSKLNLEIKQIETETRLAEKQTMKHQQRITQVQKKIEMLKLKKETALELRDEKLKLANKELEKAEDLEDIAQDLQSEARRAVDQLAQAKIDLAKAQKTSDLKKMKSKKVIREAHATKVSAEKQIEKLKQ